MHYPLASPIHGGGGPRKRWRGLASGDNASYSFLHHSGGTPFGGWRHHLCPGGKHVTGFSGRCCSPTNPVRWCNSSSFATPLKRGALWTLDIAVNLRVEQQRRENHTTGLHPWEMHPFCRLQRRLPRKGRFALHFAYRFISSTEAERKANFPLRGKPREAGIGVHFHRAEGPVCLFSPPARAAPWFS